MWGTQHQIHAVLYGSSEVCSQGTIPLFHWGVMIWCLFDYEVMLVLLCLGSKEFHIHDCYIWDEEWTIFVGFSPFFKEENKGLEKKNHMSEKNCTYSVSGIYVINETKDSIYLIITCFLYLTKLN